MVLSDFGQILCRFLNFLEISGMDDFVFFSETICCFLLVLAAIRSFNEVRDFANIPLCFSGQSVGF